MDLLKALSLIVICGPLVSAVLVGLGNKALSRNLTSWLSCILLTASCLASITIFIFLLIGKFSDTEFNLYVWGQIGYLQIPVGIMLDKLSALLITVVTFVALMVHVYSIGYMHDDPGYQRFFCYISLFTFGMLMLVLANNLVQLFFGWEAVGLLSYLLIGFWYKKDSANAASLKAFLINRVGDLGFILGIAACWYYFNTLQYSQIFAQTAAFAKTNPVLSLNFGVEWSVVTFICFCLFIGAMAKSAQVPLHVWLPDSMEGPTPISALIHAATMVTAGIFMVARMSPLFEYSDTILSFMLFIGSITCLLMGILAIVQTDIKRVVAYSTLSQLGYMVVALGASAYAAGIFHLFTHAFFKALLFLAAGSAIIAMHHEQDIFKMGNLRKYMPISCATMIIGGFALIGFPGTAGFYSKDLIIAATANSTLPFASFAYYVTLFTVLLTTLYTFRMIYLVFFAQENIEQHKKDHVHESPKVVLVPLILLAIPSLLAGIFFAGPILDNFFGNAIYVMPQHNTLEMFKAEEYHGVLNMFLHGFISWPFLCIAVGFALVWLCYIKYPQLPDVLQRDVRAVTYVLRAKYGFDAFNEKLIVPAVRMLGNVFWRVGDMLCIDKIMVNGTARSIGRTAVILRRTQTGYLYHYVFIIISGLLALIIWTIYL